MINRVIFQFRTEHLRVCVRYKLTMDLIHAELSNNDIDIDRKTLSYYINDIRKNYDHTYQEMLDRLTFNDLFRVWELMGATSFGHAMAFLTLVYVSGNTTEEDVRKAVKMTIPVLKNIDIMPYRLHVLTMSILDTPVIPYRNTTCLCFMFLYIIYNYLL